MDHKFEFRSSKTRDKNKMNAAVYTKNATLRNKSNMLFARSGDCFFSEPIKVTCSRPEKVNIP